MSIPTSVPLFRLLLCGMLVASSAALGQTIPTPPTGTLQLPPKRATTPARPPTPIKTAPREPVHRVEPKSPPVVRPHGAPHALKPPPAKPTTAVPAVAPPKPPVPVEPPKQPEAENKGSTTGLPLPRFVALRTDDVNLRAGPGTRYPIEWVYKRRELPVEILREFEVWRLVQDADGIKGWVHQATITGRRSFIITGGDATLRHEAQDSAAPVAILKVGVVGHLRSCQANSDWCQVQVDDYRGFLKRSQFWGTLPDEAVANN